MEDDMHSDRPVGILLRVVTMGIALCVGGCAGPQGKPKADLLLGSDEVKALAERDARQLAHQPRAYWTMYAIELASPSAVAEFEERTGVAVAETGRTVLADNAGAALLKAIRRIPGARVAEYAAQYDTDLFRGPDHIVLSTPTQPGRIGWAIVEPSPPNWRVALYVAQERMSDERSGFARDAWRINTGGDVMIGEWLLRVADGSGPDAAFVALFHLRKVTFAPAPSAEGSTTQDESVAAYTETR
jgi:hypothetical protein